MNELPADIKARLQSARSDDIEHFYSLIQGLRLKGWPLRTIAAALGVSHSGVATWARREDVEPAEDLPVAPKKAPAPRKETKAKVVIPEPDASRIRELAEKASGVRRFTPMNSPARAAASELEELLFRYQDKGATLTTMSNAAGVTRRAIAQRLEKRDLHEV